MTDQQERIRLREILADPKELSVAERRMPSLRLAQGCGLFFVTTPVLNHSSNRRERT
jgi:hypothetical protein